MAEARERPSAAAVSGDPDPSMIELHGLAVHYSHWTRRSQIRALDGLTADVPAGPVGLLGPNGAGKTTLIKVLLGLLVPTAGSARVAGFDPRRRSDRIALRRVVGYMPESDCLIPGRTGIELVATLGQITGLSPADAMTRAHEMLDYVELEEARYRTLEQYSTGMKQRLKLAQALVHDPQFLLLDEPTNGLDPKGRRHMLELVHDLGHNQGKNLLLCSHLLPDVEKTCTDVVVIHRGRVVASGSIDEMTRGTGELVDVRVRGEGGAFEREVNAEGLAVTAVGNGNYRVELPRDNLRDNMTGDRVFAAALRANCSVELFEPVHSTLEDVFLTVLGEAEAGGTN